MSSDTYFYTVGNDFWNVWKPATRARASGIQTRGARARLRRADRHRARRGDGPRARPDVEDRRSPNANYKTKARQAARTHLVSGRRHLPRGRPGRLFVTPLQLAERVRRRSRTAARCGRRTSSQTVTTRRRRRSCSTYAPKALRHDRLRSDDVRRRCSRASQGVGRTNPQGTAYARVPGLPARPGPGRGQDRHRAGRRARRHVAVRRVCSRPTSPQYVVVARGRAGAATARRPRRRSCARSSRR